MTRNYDLGDDARFDEIPVTDTAAGVTPSTDDDCCSDYPYYEDEWYDQDYSDDEPECVFLNDVLLKAANGQLYVERHTAWEYRGAGFENWHWETDHYSLNEYVENIEAWHDVTDVKAKLIDWGKQISRGGFMNIDDVMYTLVDHDSDEE